MSRRNVNRDALQRQEERINRAPAGQADEARNAALASQAQQRGCTSPGLRDSQLVARAGHESTPHLLSRQRPSNPAMRNRIASGARGRSGTRIRARGDRACRRWMRVWRRTRKQYISGEKQKRPRSAVSFAQGRQENSWTLPAAGRADGGAAGRMSPAGCTRLPARQPAATPAGRPRPYARQPRLDGVLLLDALKAACVHRLWALAHEWHTPSTVAPNCGASYGQRSGSCQPRTVTALGERETVV